MGKNKRRELDSKLVHINVSCTNMIGHLLRSDMSRAEDQTLQQCCEWTGASLRSWKSGADIIARTSILCSVVEDECIVAC